MMRNVRLLSALLMMGVCSPPVLHGQDDVDVDLLTRCVTASLPTIELRALCRDVVVGLQILQPEAGLALAGGNPVLGTASPLGVKFRVIPRLNIGGRVSFAFIDLPDIVNYPSSVTEPVGTLGFTLPNAQLDVSAGVFDGFDLATTIGGFAAVELMGSLSAMIFPAGDGFENDVTGFGLGTRVGILRESFTAPGMSVSLFYKWAGRLQLGNIEDGDDAQLGTDLRVWSFRGGLSKNFVSFGLAFTLGWDSYNSDVDFALRDSSGDIELAPQDDPAGLDSDRWSAHVDFSYIVLSFNLVGEVGWQEAETLALSNGSELESGKLFFTIGLRVTF